VTNSPEDEVTDVLAVAMVASLRRHYPVRFQRSAARARAGSHPLSPVQPELPCVLFVRTLACGDEPPVPAPGSSPREQDSLRKQKPAKTLCPNGPRRLPAGPSKTASQEGRRTEQWHQWHHCKHRIIAGHTRHMPLIDVRQLRGQIAYRLI
jgi:hypothetical protein